MDGRWRAAGWRRPEIVGIGGSANRSQGLDRWTYNFGGDVSQVRDFSLRMTTNFKDIDFPDNTLSPTAKRQTADGWS